MIGAWAPCLTELTLFECDCTAAGLQHGLSCLTALEQFTVDFPEALTDDDLFGLVDACLPSLRRLEFRHCGSLGNFAVSLLERLSTVQEIVFIYCSCVPATGISALLVHDAPSLQRVVVDEECGLDAAGLALCRQRAAATERSVKIGSKRELGIEL